MISSKLALMMTNPSTSLRPQDVFATSLYTGNGSAQTITNGINLSGEGGLVWAKKRNQSGYDHVLYDTVRGATKYLSTNNNFSEGTQAQGVTAFNTSGFLVGSNANINENTFNYVAWTFRRASKFFDVVTWAGNGASNRTINHSLGTIPGLIIIKRTDSVVNWPVWHRSGTQTYTYSARLNSGHTYHDTGDDLWGSSGVNVGSSAFNIGAGVDVNASGGTYIAYLFAHDTNAGGIIQCGGYVGSNTGQSISLGWKPQYLLIKCITTGYDWFVADAARRLNSSGTIMLNPNNAYAEVSYGAGYVITTATGFTLGGGWGNFNSDTNNYIYLAIREPV